MGILSSQDVPDAWAGPLQPLLEDLLGASPVGLGVLDRELRFVWVNPALAAMNGHSPEAHVGRTPLELVPGVPPETYLPALRRALGGELVTGVAASGETPARPGVRRFWESSFHPLPVGGSPVSGVGIVTVDVTARVEVEASLGEREATMRLVLDSAPNAMIVVDGDGRVVDLNPEAQRLFGYTAAELVGQSIELLVPARSRAGHPGHRARFHEDPLTRRMGHGRDLWAVRKDGSEFPVEVGLGVTSGRGDRVTCVVTDLSGRHAADAERAALLRAEQAARLDAERAREDLARLQHVTEAGLAELGWDDLQRALLERVLDVTRADAATVLLLDDSGELLVPAASLGLEDEIEAGVVIPVGRGVAGRVAMTRQPRVVADLRLEDVHSEVLRRSDLRAMVAVPLLAAGELIGVLHVAAAEVDRFDAADQAFLQRVADRVALAVERARAFERERAIAETLQRSLLPDQLPQVERVSLAARYVPGTAGARVGGDWYDVLTREGGVSVVVGDVMGHGIPAAALMGQLRHAVRAYLTTGAPLPEVAARANRLLHETDDATITTLLVASIDTRSGRLAWVSAGHLPPLVRRQNGGAVLLADPPDPPLGADPTATYTCHRAELERGATLLLYTDGLIERRDEPLDVGLDRLPAVAAGAAGDPGDLCDVLLEAFGADGRAADDVALLALRLDPLLRPLSFRVPARPALLRDVRRVLGSWLEDAGASHEERSDILVAVTEALRTGGGGSWEVTADLVDDRVEIAVREEEFQPEPRADTDRGRGLVLMEAFVDELTITRAGPTYRTRLSRRLAQRDPSTHLPEARRAP